MFGAICGDTIGSSYEFNNTRDYNFTLFSPESDFTDDSILSVAVAYWLLSDPDLSEECLVETVLHYTRKYPCPMGSYGVRFSEWIDNPEMGPYNSWGNGSAMRASACGWFFDTLEETERVAGISASITHNHPEGIKGAQATAAAIWMARNGESKEEIKNYISARYGYDLTRSYVYLNATYDWDSSCQGTVPEAIIAFLESTDFEDAMRKAVSMGGDSDTLACITGGIAEAYYKEIPEEIKTVVWSKLPKGFKEMIQAVADRTAYKEVFNGYGLKAE